MKNVHQTSSPLYVSTIRLKRRVFENWWLGRGGLVAPEFLFAQSPEDGHLYCIFTYSYYIISRVKKLATSLLVLRHYDHLFLFSMLNTARDVRHGCVYIC